MADLVEETFQSEAARWSAVINRDAGADGIFYYAVKTTGVYCRPQCGARQPLRTNVAFFDSGDLAEIAGFRPCKRCKPRRAGKMNDYSALVATACRWIESAEQAPTLAEVSTQVGLSPYYFHRIFKQVTGVTPKAYAQAHRGQMIQKSLKNESTITAAIYAAGYQASSRFYEESPHRLGMTPSQYKRGGIGLVIRHVLAESAMGPLLIAATDKGICFIQFGENALALIETLNQHFPKATLEPGDDRFTHWVAEVLTAIEDGRTPDPQLPLDIRGTAFQQQVWQALRDIPKGETASYAQVAQRIGKPKAVRAVANACASNNLAIAIPCHRVIRSDGGLGGYRWGEKYKRELLAREASQ